MAITEAKIQEENKLGDYKGSPHNRLLSEHRPTAGYFGQEASIIQRPSIMKPQIINFNDYHTDNLMFQSAPKADKETTDFAAKSKNTYRDAFEKKLIEIDKKLQKECLYCHGNNRENHIVELPDALAEDVEVEEEDEDYWVRL